MDFMLKQGLAMRKCIEYKQKTNPIWKNGCDMVVSGLDVPGEGEHKVSFGRSAFDYSVIWIFGSVARIHATHPSPVIAT